MDTLIKKKYDLKKVGTSKTFLKDFRGLGGIELFNNRSDEYYYFNKATNGKIYEGMFYPWLESYTEKSWIDYEYVYDIKEGVTYLRRY